MGVAGTVDVSVGHHFPHDIVFSLLGYYNFNLQLAHSAFPLG